MRILVVDGMTLLERLLVLGIVVLLGTDILGNFTNTAITLGTESFNFGENAAMTVVQAGATDLTTAVSGLADLWNLGADRLRTSAEVVGAAL